MSEQILFTDIEELKLLNNKLKNNSLKKLIGFYDYVIINPYYESYKALKVLMANLNEDLLSEQITLLNVASKEGGDDKSFLYAHKYATEIKFYYEQLDYLKSKMLPEDVIQADREASSLLDEARLSLKK
jgi:hypothetical protein